MIPPLAGLLLGLLPQADPPPAGDAHALFEFPAGRLAERVAALDPRLLPAATPGDLGRPDRSPGVATNAWANAETWTAWSGLVEAERDAARPDPERRARLALLALAQERSGDAWEHLALIEDPRWLAAVLPRFLPGVPPGAPIGVGGASGALEDGAVLAPALPPPTHWVSRGSGIDRRTMSVRTFAVGRAFVSMRVSVEAEGVQVDVRHVGGGSARLAVLLPAHPDFEFVDEYLDWYRQDTHRVPLSFEVQPGEAEHTLYGRFQPRTRRLHAGVPRQVPGSIREGGLWFEIASDDPARPFLAAIAAAISQRSFGFPLGVREPRAAGTTWSGVAFPLGDASARAGELAWLASAVERFTLSDRPR